MGTRGKRGAAFILFVICLASYALTGCAGDRELAGEDYERAESYLKELDEVSYHPVRKAENDKFRIAYVDIDPYPPSGEMLYYFIKELESQGWIDLPEKIPFHPLNTDARKLIEYMASLDLGDYLEFPPDACYYLSVDGEESCREDLQEQIEQGQVDLIFCMGTWPGQFVKEMGVTDVPVMVYFCVDPVGAGLSAGNEDSGQDNFWCHINYTVYGRQLQFYHDNFDFSNIGMAYYDETVAAMRAYREVADREGFLISEKKVKKLTGTDEEDEEEYYTSLKETYRDLVENEGIDAFLLSTDILKDEERIPEMLHLFYENKIPVFVQNGEYFVKEGALMMVTASDARGQAPFVADAFSAILNGVSPRSLKQEFLPSPYLCLNLGAANEMGYQAPWELILSAEKIYEVNDR